MASSEKNPFIVHCHLRWDGVWQRPQQLLSRLSRTRNITFIEEPIFLPPVEGNLFFPDGEGMREYEEKNGFLRIRDENGLTVVTPIVRHQTEILPYIIPENQQLVQRLLRTYYRHSGLLNSDGTSPASRWYYTPMALYIDEANDIDYSGALVYDCMDNLDAFVDMNPPTLGVKGTMQAREKELLERADVVFTGGRTMYEQRKEKTANCHRFDSGVDVDHFQQATREETPVPEIAQNAPRPIIGYYGVIDERMDYAAIKAIADANPEATVLMIGPVTKVDPALLPQAKNIIYTGQSGYDDLPRYLKSFDVALVPFAMNEATYSLSPTKTLEYFAGEKPVVSSRIKDVVDNYGDIVRLVDTPEDYVAAVQATLQEDNSDRIRRGLEEANQKTWDVIVEQMSSLLEEAEAKTLK